MTDSEKRLLSIDLSGRLPYGVKVRCISVGETMPQVWNLIGMPTAEHCDIIVPNERRFSAVPIQDVKPYLRSLSSMSQKEIEEYRKMSYYGAFGIRNEDFTETVAVPSFEKMDYLDSHHFDHRGLIDKGLALQAPEGMYNFV